MQVVTGPGKAVASLAILTGSLVRLSLFLFLSFQIDDSIHMFVVFFVLIFLDHCTSYVSNRRKLLKSLGNISNRTGDREDDSKIKQTATAPEANAQLVDKYQVDSNVL